MYTDTSRPNHLAQEVIDNAVDEALGGHARRIDVIAHGDGSMSVEDDGRGMPVDIHPEEGVPGIEVILTRLHAGGKFSDKSYQFSGGLHGVGVSVVNALSTRLQVTVRRDGQEHAIEFRHGEKSTDLRVVGSVGRRNTGTTLRFWPDTSYFDVPRFGLPRLRHLLRAKAVLCPGLAVSLTDEATGERDDWVYEDGLSDYLRLALADSETLPSAPFVGHMSAATEAVDWAMVWLAPSDEDEPSGPSAGLDLPTESYVNLVPTMQGGTHVNGLRSGLLEALREYCEFRSLTPRGVKLAADDVWDRLSYVLSVKMSDPQFTGQTKERLSSRECASFVAGVVKDTFSLWLNQHTDTGDRLAEAIIARAQARLRSAKIVTRKKIASGPALPGKLSDCSSQDVTQTELFLVEGDSAGGSAKQARDREFQAVMPLRGKILNTWELESTQVLGSQEVHDIAIAIGVDPGKTDIAALRYGKICILADADSDGAHIATLLCALFLRHFRPLVETGHVFVAMPPLYRIDAGDDVSYALDESEKDRIVERLMAEKRGKKPEILRFKGLGEMNPSQLRETTMAPATRRLVRMTVAEHDHSADMLDMLLAKRRAGDRRSWLEKHGDMADVI
ncbi:MAG: topoisomerase-4 subunit B [Gammaproteobacteria bacterium]|jgi:topoisomerase-4 subunit B